MTVDDTPGPITLGYAAQKSYAGANGALSAVVVIGDTNFIANGNISMQANGDLFINSVNWLAGGRETEIIAGKVINSNIMVVRGSDFTRLMIICCIVIPAVVFAGAAMVWRARRNK
jgi:ABC-type uncharacterized transport system involved in gliding motility auxiliary subunit